MKKCSSCGEMKELVFFGKKKAARDGLQSFCKPCNRAYQQAHYATNKEDYLERNKRVVAETREWLAAYKTGKPCTDCGGVFHHVAMDFDHLGGKLFDVSDMIKHGKKKILEEIAKCELVCSNCHRVRTYERMLLSSNRTGR